MIPVAAKNALFLVLASKYADSDTIYSEGFARALDEALEAAAPYLMAQAFDEGQKSGMRHAERLIAAAKIGRPDLPGPLSPNPYRKDAK